MIKKITQPMQLILVVLSFTLNITNLSAMKPETGTPNSKHTSPARERHVSFDEKNILSTKKSPSKSIERLVNFYKMSINALRDGNLQAFEASLYNFFGQIPHNLKINDQRLYKALFFVIADLFGKVYTFDENKDVYYLFLKTDENGIFALEFRVHDSRNTDKSYTQLKFLPQSEKSANPICIIKITIDIAQNDLLSMHTRHHRKSEVIYEIPCKIFKQLKYVTDNPLRTIQEAIEHLNGEYKNDPKIMHTVITDAFTLLYNSIPPDLRISSEKFYQSLFFLLMLFVRSGSIDQEVRSLIGRSDAVIFTPTNSCIIEFKYRASFANAMKQILEKRYCLPLHESQKPIWMLGVNIDKNCTVTTGLEQYSKENSPTYSPKAKKLVFSKLSDLF